MTSVTITSNLGWRRHSIVRMAIILGRFGVRILRGVGNFFSKTSGRTQWSTQHLTQFVVDNNATQSTQGLFFTVLLGIYFTAVQAYDGSGSVVGIATGYWLDGRGIESRWRSRFSAPVQTGPGAHQSTFTMGTGSFPGVKSGRGVTLTPSPPSSAVVMKE